LYTHTFSIYDFNISSLEELIGYPFHLSVRDHFDHTTIFELGAINRVIGEEVFFREPSGNEITGQTPTLIWDGYAAGFDFTYKVEIFTADLTPQLQWQKEQIDRSETSCVVDTALPEGPYYWVIWVIDNFGNRIRSKPASFTVAQPAN
jgi:hypothetical protein